MAVTDWQHGEANVIETFLLLKFSRRREHATPHKTTGEAQGWLRRGQRGEPRLEPISGFLRKDKTGQGKQLRTG